MSTSLQIHMRHLLSDCISFLNFFRTVALKKFRESGLLFSPSELELRGGRETCVQPTGLEKNLELPERIFSSRNGTHASLMIQCVVVNLPCVALCCNNDELYLTLLN